MKRYKSLYKEGNYKYDVVGGYVKGFFNIYQAKNGYLYLMMGKVITKLEKNQIDDLNIDVYSLIDFDFDNYKKAYGI